MEKTKTAELYDKAKEAGKVKELLPWLKLGIKKKDGGVESTGPHKVVFVEDKIVKGQDYHTKQERLEVEYIFEENGEQKRYRVPVYGKDGNLHYFLERMKDFNYGDELILEMKWVGDKNVIEVSRVDEIERTDDGIPVIEEDATS